jgi:hypothetical protein
MGVSNVDANASGFAGFVPCAVIAGAGKVSDNLKESNSQIILKGRERNCGGQHALSAK